MKIVDRLMVYLFQPSLRPFSSLQQPRVSWRKWVVGSAIAGGSVYCGWKWLQFPQIHSMSNIKARPFESSDLSLLCPQLPLKIAQCQNIKPTTPLLSSFWVDRPQEMQAIEAALSKRHLSTAICLLNGLPGVGKTQLALRVMRKYNDRYLDSAGYVDVHSAKTKFPEEHKHYRELLVIDNIASSQDLEQALIIINEVKPKRALLIGCYNPINPSYFKTRMIHIELQGLSRKEIGNLIEEIQSLPGREEFTAKGIEEIQDTNGRYHPALFWAAAIACGEKGFTNIGEIIEHRPKEAFSKHRPEYLSMEDRYRCLFESLSVEEEYAVCLISQASDDKLSFSLDELGLREGNEIPSVVGLLELMILERFVQGEEVRYRVYDRGFLNFVKKMELEPRWKISKTDVAIAVIAAVAFYSENLEELMFPII